MLLNLILGVLLMAGTLNVPLKLFNERYLFLLREPCRSAPTQIIYGGAASGKSVFIAQRDVLDMVNEGRNFLIIRNTANTLRSSVFEERKKAIINFGLIKLFDIRESDLNITYRPRGNVMMFRGLDDPEKLKSITTPVGPLTDIRYEEATEVSESAIIEIGRRMRGLSAFPKREVYSFNPIFRSHWICKKFFKGELVKYRRDEDLLIFHSTYRDNKFLTEQDKKRIASYTGYQRDVYCDGKWGVLGDLIFTNWEVADVGDVQFDNVRHGLDFGFTNDPSALVEVGISTAKKTLYITREQYIHGATNDVLAAKIEPIVGGNPVFCDSAEPKSIAELHQYGIGAHAVAKGKDSVWHALQWLQQWHIVIDRRCQNTINEFSQYQWLKNKNGDNLNEPIGTNDHAIAALRYATEQDRININPGMFVIG